MHPPPPSDHDLNTCKCQWIQHKTLGGVVNTKYVESIHFCRKITKLNLWT